jgi:hypothetical protein
MPRRWRNLNNGRRPPRHARGVDECRPGLSAVAGFPGGGRSNGPLFGPSSFCKTLRLMAGHETASEGFAPGQTGSSAMPHKMNSRSCERVNGFHVILKGYLAMAAGLAGDQWNEGDVSCSVVRRVMLPDAFLPSMACSRLSDHSRPDGRLRGGDRTRRPRTICRS